MGVGSYCPDCAREEAVDRLRGKARVTLRKRTLAAFGYRCAALVDGERCVAWARSRSITSTATGPTTTSRTESRSVDRTTSSSPACRERRSHEPVEPWIA